MEWHGEIENVLVGFDIVDQNLDTLFIKIGKGHKTVSSVLCQNRMRPCGRKQPKKRNV